MRVPGYHDGHLRAYGLLVPGTVVVMREDSHLDESTTVPLDGSLHPILLPGFSAQRTLGRLRAYRAACRSLRPLIERATFVQVQYPGALGLIAGSIAGELGKTIYVDMHGSLQDPPGVTTPRSLRNRLAIRLYYTRQARNLARSARLLIAVSDHLHATFPASDAPRVLVSGTLIETDAIYVRGDACEHRPLRLFVAARMIESKGIHHLLRAVRQLLDRGEPVRLGLAGVGDYLPRLKKLAVDLGLEPHVDFHGGVPTGERLWALFRRADIVILPSLGQYEGTPRMIIEAWAAGAPVIATRVGGIPSMVRDGRDALLVPPGDVAALVEAVSSVRDDHALRERLVRSAYDRVRTLTVEARLRILRSALAKHLPGLLPEGAE